MPTRITDVWFRSNFPVQEIAAKLGLKKLEVEAETYWTWVIGQLGETRLDITRTHAQPAALVDTRIFLFKGGDLPEAVLSELIGKLQNFVFSPIYCGECGWRAGDDIDLIVARTYEPLLSADSHSTNLDVYINAAVAAGEAKGISNIGPLQRTIYLIAEAEGLCDMDGIDTFLDRYFPTWQADTVTAFETIGASEIAAEFRKLDDTYIHCDARLQHLHELISSRTGYDYDSIRHAVADRLNER